MGVGAILSFCWQCVQNGSLKGAWKTNGGQILKMDPSKKEESQPFQHINFVNFDPQIKRLSKTLGPP